MRVLIFSIKDVLVLGASRNDPALIWPRAGRNTVGVRSLKLCVDKGDRYRFASTGVDRGQEVECPHHLGDIDSLLTFVSHSLLK